MANVQYTTQDLEQYLKEKCNYSEDELSEILYKLLDQGRDLYYKEALEYEVIQSDGDMDMFVSWIETLENQRIDNNWEEERLREIEF